MYKVLTSYDLIPREVYHELSLYFCRESIKNVTRKRAIIAIRNKSHSTIHPTTTALHTILAMPHARDAPASRSLS